jgi:hypothetical protein
LLDEPLSPELAGIQEHFDTLCDEMQVLVLGFISGFRETENQKLLQLLLGVVAYPDSAPGGMDTQIFMSLAKRDEEAALALYRFCRGKWSQPAFIEFQVKVKSGIFSRDWEPHCDEAQREGNWWVLSNLKDSTMSSMNKLYTRSLSQCWLLNFYRDGSPLVFTIAKNRQDVVGNVVVHKDQLQFEKKNSRLTYNIVVYMCGSELQFTFAGPYNRKVWLKHKAGKAVPDFLSFRRIRQDLSRWSLVHQLEETLRFIPCVVCDLIQGYSCSRAL